MKKYYNLEKIAFKNWNEALDQFLKYKSRNPQGSFDDWYNVLKKTHHITNKIKKTDYGEHKKISSIDEQIINEAFTEAEHEIIKMLENLEVDVEISHGTESYSSNVKRAIKEAECFARRAHAGQYRENGEPYIRHIENVVNIIISNPNSNTPEAIIVAWLHDVINKTPYNHEHLLQFPWFTTRMLVSIEELELGFFESYGEYVERLKLNNLAWVIKLGKLMSLIDDNPSHEEQIEIEKICDFLEDEL